MILGGNSSDERRGVNSDRGGNLRKINENSTILRRRTTKILSSVLMGIVVSSEQPLVSHANTLLLTEANKNEYISSRSWEPLEPSFGTAVLPFHSASATRLLVDPIPPASSERISAETKRKLASQRELQDSRLEQCRESTTMDWEQCFFYGRSEGGNNSRRSFIQNYQVISSNRFDAGGSAVIKMGIPTTTKPTKIPTW